MNDRNSPKVVDLKSRGERVANSQFGNFVPDEELLQSTARIKNQRDLILDRLEKMSDAQNRVSKTVFEKVKRDYSLQLETISELLVEKKHLLKEEIKKLYLNREKLAFEINRHREILEEAEFRHFLSEFTQTQYQEVENFETREIEKLESDLSHISQWIRSHEELFDPEDFGQKRAEKRLEQPPEPAPLQQPPARPEAKIAAPVPPPPASAAPQVKTPEPPAVASRKPEPQTQPSERTVTAQVPATTAPQISAPAVEQPLIAKQDAPVDLQKTEKAIVPLSVEDDAAAEHDADEFSYLFADGQESPAPEASVDFSATESNIKALLEQTTPQAPQPTQTAPTKPEVPAAKAPTEPARPTTPEPKPQAPVQTKAPLPPAPVVEEDPEEIFIPEPEESENDYFTDDKSEEVSVSVATSLDDDSITAAKGEVSVPAPAPDRQVLRPDPQKPVNRDESISNILDSIRIDEDTGAKQQTTAEPAASVETEFKLILTQGDLDDKIYAVKENTSIGRSPSNDVVLKEPKVSRQHAAINKYNEHYIIIDLKSSNGVYVNGVKVDECVLHPGDEISIGGYKFQFQQA